MHLSDEETTCSHAVRRAGGAGVTPMDIVGYADRFSVAPGEGIRFMVSTASPAFELAIVRLIHGDTKPDGPGFK